MTETTLSANQSQVIPFIAADMRGVDALIAQRLTTSVALVGDVSQYIIAAGGKRLRPQLLLLCCGALGFNGASRLTMAAVVEFIHTATLLHDDVVDESTLRRGLPTANARFGNPASVLIGDFLYSRAFQMMVEVQDMRIMEVLANATNVIAEGEVLQLMNMHNADLSESDYLQVIRSKTSKLFEASAQVGAILAKSEQSVERACATFGQALGTAFQVIDDVLDYAGDSALLGKNLGDDLREGKCTLPLITAMQLAGADDAATVRRAIEQGDVSALEQVATIVKRTGALDAAMRWAQSEISRALDAAKYVPNGPYRDCMVQLAEQSLGRNS
jgi:octaprenyl-diphosphate synthase